MLYIKYNTWILTHVPYFKTLLHFQYKTHTLQLLSHTISSHFLFYISTVRRHSYPLSHTDWRLFAFVSGVAHAQNRPPSPHFLCPSIHWPSIHSQMFALSISFLGKLLCALFFPFPTALGSFSLSILENFSSITVLFILFSTCCFYCLSLQRKELDPFYILNT